MRILFAFLLFSVCSNLEAQSLYRIGVLPGINLNVKLKNTWRINIRTESRLDVAKGKFSEASKPNFDYDLTDVSIIVSKRIGLRHQVAGGYLLRLESGQIAHRLIQQVTFIQEFNKLRIGHRLFTDQTFFVRESPIFRLRYRLGVELPLQGISVDPKEFYTKFSNELIGSLQSKTLGFENRLAPVIGYAFTDNNKLEWGLDYRTTIIQNRNPLHTFWVSINWFVSI